MYVCMYVYVCVRHLFFIYVCENRMQLTTFYPQMGT